MKSTQGLLIIGIALMAVAQFTYAQQVPTRVHTPPLITSAAGDLSATDEVIGDSMVLPLLGMSDHIDGRLAFLEAEIKPTSAQLPLWNAFASAARANAAAENAMLQEQNQIPISDSTAASLPQRLEAHERHLRAHLKMLQTISTALLPLYASLSDEQKKVAEGLVNGAAGL